MTLPAPRVTHVGDAPDGCGGIASVLRNYATTPWPLSDVRVLPTYHRGSPGRTVTAWLWALAVVLAAPASRVGVVHVHVSWRGSFVREGAVLVLASLCGRPVVATVHGAEFVAWSAEHRVLAGTVLRRADAVTVLFPAAADRVRALGVRRVAVIPNAVPFPAQGVAPRLDRVVFAGEVCRRKGVDVLLAAWPLVLQERPEARLVLLGPASDVPLAGRIGERLGVQWWGEQSAAVVAAELRQARVAVLPSRDEALPMFLLEAMAAGCAVVATPVGGIPELFDGRGGSGEPGELVPVGDANALAAALVRSLDPAVGARRGSAGRAVVLAGYANAGVQQELERLWAASRERAQRAATSVNARS